MFFIIGVLFNINAISADNVLVTCISNKINGHNHGYSIRQSIIIELLAKENEQTLSLLYTGPTYSAAATPGELNFDQSSRSRFFTKNFKCKNIPHIGYYCNLRTSGLGAFLFDFKLRGNVATLRYQDGKPISIDAKLNCR